MFGGNPISDYNFISSARTAGSQLKGEKKIQTWNKIKRIFFIKPVKIHQ